MPPCLQFARFPKRRLLQQGSQRCHGSGIEGLLPEKGIGIDRLIDQHAQAIHGGMAQDLRSGHKGRHRRGVNAVRRRSPRLLLRRAGVLALALLLFLVPWTLRNARAFGAFVPLTYGAGQPMLQGTYQGEGFPLDEELDYETNVHQVMLSRYAAYYRDEAQPREADTDSAYALLYDPLGEVKDEQNAQYLSMQRDGLKARYRLRRWWERSPGSLLKSYLLIKPRWTLNWAWAWERRFRYSASWRTWVSISLIPAIRRRPPFSSTMAALNWT